MRLIQAPFHVAQKTSYFHTSFWNTSFFSFNRDCGLVTKQKQTKPPNNNENTTSVGNSLSFATGNNKAQTNILSPSSGQILVLQDINKEFISVYK